MNKVAYDFDHQVFAYGMEVQDPTSVEVDNVYHGLFNSPTEAYDWLDENIPDWGDRDTYVESSEGVTTTNRKDK